MVSLPTSPDEGNSASRRLRLVRLVQVGIVGVLLEGLRRRHPGVTANGLAALLFAATPRYLESAWGVSLRPWQRLWVAASSLVHALGMLGPYDRVWWWDHVTHTLTGVVVAGATDVVYRAERGLPGRSTLPFRSRASAVVAVTLGFGLLWEVVEYATHAAADRLGFQLVLIHYGRRDTVVDLVFDLLAAGVVIRYGESALSNVPRQIDDAGRSEESD